MGCSSASLAHFARTRAGDLTAVGVRLRCHCPPVPHANQLRYLATRPAAGFAFRWRLSELQAGMLTGGAGSFEMQVSTGFLRFDHPSFEV